MPEINLLMLMDIFTSLVLRGIYYYRKREVFLKNVKVQLSRKFLLLVSGAELVFYYALGE